jgi:hydrogenase nickel incorporation protein HypA/HybF
VHELGVTEAILATAIEVSGGKKVTRIVLEIGKETAIFPDAIRFCFGLCSEGTLAEGAKLEIRELEGGVFNFKELEVA